MGAPEIKLVRMPMAEFLEFYGKITATDRPGTLQDVTKCCVTFLLPFMPGQMLIAEVWETNNRTIVRRMFNVEIYDMPYTPLMHDNKDQDILTDAAYDEEMPDADDTPAYAPYDGIGDEEDND